jgi:hypothetical protein
MLYIYVIFNFVGSYSTTFSIINRCSLTVFPGIFHGAGTSLPSTTGFALPPGKSNIVNVPPSWLGRLWGKTHCSHESNGKFSCLTGDCASYTMECDGGNASPPVTLAEFNLNITSGFDFFRVSVLDGYNLLMMVEPQVGNGVGDCMTTGCMIHLNKMCPLELKVITAGDCIGCRSACQPSSKYCNSEFFTKACPHANVDVTKTFQSVCASTDYLITFCPNSTRLVSHISQYFFYQVHFY